jgi:hypothetical protein
LSGRFFGFVISSRRPAAGIVAGEQTSDFGAHGRNGRFFTSPLC